CASTRVAGAIFCATASTDSSRDNTMMAMRDNIQANPVGVTGDCGKPRKFPAANAWSAGFMAAFGCGVYPHSRKINSLPGFNYAPVMLESTEVFDCRSRACDGAGRASRKTCRSTTGRLAAASPCWLAIAVGAGADYWAVAGPGACGNLANWPAR